MRETIASLFIRDSKAEDANQLESKESEDLLAGLFLPNHHNDLEPSNRFRTNQDLTTPENVLALAPNSSNRHLSKGNRMHAQGGISQNSESLYSGHNQKKNYLDSTKAHADKQSKKDGLNSISNDDVMAMYLKEVGNIPLLTAKEELSITRRIELGHKAREKLADAEISSKDRIRLQKLIEDGWAACEHLILANSRLVISIAKRYKDRGVPFIDLIQEGNIGLIRAAKKFDYRRGYKFSTYATWWIRQAITRCIADQGRTIRIPVHMGDKINKLSRVTYNLTQCLGHKPRNEEISAAMNISIEKVEDILQATQQPLSLDMPSGDEENNSINDFIPDRGTPKPDEMVYKVMMSEHLHEILQSLPPREVQVLQMRYGLQKRRPLNLREIAQKLGITRERVRQIESQALRRLRQPKIRRQLIDYIRS